jgi:hypothetical protein
VASIETIRLSKGFRTVARVLGVVAIALGILNFILDKFLPYRIGPSYYTFYLFTEVLAIASLAVMILALFVGVASGQWRSCVLAVVGMVMLFSMNPVHSGPNPEAWCYNNLRTIEAAKEQLAKDKNLTNGTVVTSEQLSPYIEGGFASLKCAERGEYIINPIGIEPRCTFHGSMSEMETKWKKLSQ